MDRDWVVDTSNHHYTLLDIPELAKQVYSDNDDLKLSGVKGLRLLSAGSPAPIQEILDSGVVPQVIEGLRRFDFSQLQYESAWLLSNISTGDYLQIQTLVGHYCIPLLIDTLRSPNERVRCQAAWCLSNIAAESVTYRDFILNNGAIALLIGCIETSSNQDDKKTITWALGNLCNGKPSPNYNVCKDALLTLARVLLETQDFETMTECCYAISNISEGDNPDIIEDIIESRVLPKLVELANGTVSFTQQYSLSICKNIAAGTLQSRLYLISCGVLLNTKYLLCSPKALVRKFTLQLLGNITRFGVHHQCLVEVGVMPSIIQMIESSDTLKIEALQVLESFILNSQLEHIMHLVNCGVIKALCYALKGENTSSVITALVAIDHILSIGQVHFAGFIEQEVVAHEGLIILEQLRTSSDFEVSRAAINLIIRIFGEKSEGLVDHFNEMSL